MSLSLVSAGVLVDIFALRVGCMALGPIDLAGLHCCYACSHIVNVHLLGRALSCWHVIPASSMVFLVRALMAIPLLVLEVGVGEKERGRGGE